MHSRPTPAVDLARWIGRYQQTDERPFAPRDRALLAAASAALLRRRTQLAVGLAVPIAASLPIGFAVGAELLPAEAQVSRGVGVAVFGTMFALLTAAFLGALVEFVDPLAPRRRLQLGASFAGMVVLVATLFSQRLPSAVALPLLCGGGLALVAWTGIGGAALFERARALSTANALVRLLADDLAGGTLLRFEARAGAGGAPPPACDVLPRSCAIVRVGDAEVLPAIEVVPITVVDASAATRLDAPLRGPSPVATPPGVVWRQRPLSPAERAELSTLVSRETGRLARRALGVAFGASALARLLDRWLWDGPQVGLGWRGALLALAAVAAFMAPAGRRRWALGVDLKRAKVLVARGPDGASWAEVLSDSGVVWTEAGAPSAWRAPG